jgi:hypothetical protein
MHQPQALRIHIALLSVESVEAGNDTEMVAESRDTVGYPLYRGRNARIGG